MATTLIEPRQAQQTVLSVDREGIGLHNVSPDLVRIEITVRNLGTSRSCETPVQLQSAPLGAFLPWRPLRGLTAPPLDPGGETRLHTCVERTPVEALGEFPRVPPRRLLTLVSAADHNDDHDQPRARRESAWRQMSRKAPRETARNRPNRLAADVFECLGHRKSHWAGNINVFVGEQSVERHMAHALRVYPGRTNLAIFFVGTFDPDAYSFELRGSSLSQHASLVNVVPDPSLVETVEDAAVIPERQWVGACGPLAVMLVLRLPGCCQQGELVVHVCQRSSGRRAVVEFSLDPNAVGPGCFTL